MKGSRGMDMKDMTIRTGTWVATLALAALVACGGDGGGGTDVMGGDTAMNDTPVMPGGVSCDGSTCVLTGTITEDVTLTSDKNWLLRGGVFIGDEMNETILTVEPGTTVYGESSTNGFLVIRRGSKIMAEGTKDAPIVFTSSKAVGSRSRGDWGGVIVNGRATINSCGSEAGALCEAFGEGGTGYYGGDKDNDNSGVMKYVRVEFAGRLISPENELNGIAFQGVGSGTTLDYLQLHMAKDDAMEFFGGTVNFKHVLATGGADDNLDWTDGWRGKGQFFVAQQYEDNGDQGIEADNNAEDNSAMPRAMPTLSNLTLIGSPDSEHSDIGMLLREGTGARIYNTVVTGFNEACLNIDHAETFANAMDGANLSGELTITNSILFCSGVNPASKDFKKDSEKDADGNTVTDPFDIEDFFLTKNSGNQVTDPMLKDAFNLNIPDFTPKAGSPLESGAMIPDDSFFEKVSFRGGVDPANDWTKGWTTSARN